MLWVSSGPLALCCGAWVHVLQLGLIRSPPGRFPGCSDPSRSDCSICLWNSFFFKWCFTWKISLFSGTSEWWGRERGVSALPWATGSLKGRAGTWGSRKHLIPQRTTCPHFSGVKQQDISWQLERTEFLSKRQSFQVPWKASKLWYGHLWRGGFSFPQWGVSWGQLAGVA